MRIFLIFGPCVEMVHAIWRAAMDNDLLILSLTSGRLVTAAADMRFSLHPTI